MEDIRQRCHVDEAGCWIWKLGCNSRGEPQAWSPTLRTTTTVDSVMHHLCKGCKIPKGKVWRAACGEQLCVNEQHRRYAPRAYRGRKSELHMAKLTLGRRAVAKLTPEAVKDIRASTDTHDAAAARNGVTGSTIGRIRRGQSWRPLGPASVFNLAR